MFVLAAMAQKGGVGKTTLCLNLAAAAVAEGKQVVVVDMDRQGSLIGWGQRRAVVTGFDDRPFVAAPNKEGDLPEILESCEEEGVDYVFVDTMPRIERDQIAAIRSSDLVLVPTQPGAFDLESVAVTAQIAHAESIQARLVLNTGRPGASPHGASINMEAIHMLRDAGYSVWDKPIIRRVAYQDSQAEGRTVMDYTPADNKARREIRALWRWLKGGLNGKVS